MIAYIFDLDGTLFDSSNANVIAYTHAFADVGLTLDEQAYRHNFGLRFDEMMKLLAPMATERTLQHIKQAKAKYYAENLSEVRPNDGLIELLKSSKTHSKTALVTTASKNNVEALFSFFSLPLNLFNVMISGEDVKHSKPDPECYKLAIERLGTTPKDCFVFEDSEIGCKAARAAGAHVIRVVL